MFISLTSTDGKLDEVGLGDYLSRNVLGEMRRLDGVGRAQLFAPSARCASGSIRTRCSASD
jgi:multidrug efflux pump